MEYSVFRKNFLRIFEKNGLIAYADESAIRKFYDLTDLMLETNRVMNITALTTTDKIIPLHYADCVKATEWIPQNATVADIGCGGGFPVLPLAIVRPDLRITGIDSTEKKIRYVQSTAEKLGLQVTAISGRAEELAKNPEHRDSYDCVISRAVARLNILNELCLPYVKVGGRLIALKGAAGEAEYLEAKNGIFKMGGELESLISYKLYMNEEEEQRYSVIIQKNSPTPKEYPRTFGNIKKKPL